jgi:hypothetical protein
MSDGLAPRFTARSRRRALGARRARNRPHERTLFQFLLGIAAKKPQHPLEKTDPFRTLRREFRHGRQIGC